MEKESRVKKSLLNARVNTICYFISILIAFFTRKIFIDYLGSEFIGYTTTLQSLLGFLNLAELGIGSAIGYVLYRPIFDGDENKINEIISVFGFLYRVIGYIILISGIILSMFLPIIFPNTSFSWFVIYLGFYSFLSSSLLGYFVNYKQTLLSADQRNYEVTGYYQATLALKSIIQMILAIYINSFSLYLFNEILFGIIYSIILNYRINKVYPWLKSDVKLGKKLFKKYPQISTYIKQIFIHKIATFVQIQSSPLFIYSFVSLPIVTLYSNYTILTTKIQGLMTGILNSTGAGIGNLISENNKSKIYNTYKELLSIRFLSSGILSSCIYLFSTPFIYTWLGKEYILSDSIVTLITVNFFLVLSRGTTDQFIYGYGLFYDIWAPITESIIFLVSALIFGALWGLEGILLAPLISLIIIVHIWKPYFLYSKGFNIKIVKYFYLVTINIVPITISFFLSKRLLNAIFINFNQIASWSELFLSAIVFFILISTSSIILMFITSSGFRSFISRFINIKHKIS